MNVGLLYYSNAVVTLLLSAPAEENDPTGASKAGKKRKAFAALGESNQAMRVTCISLSLSISLSLHT